MKDLGIVPRFSVQTQRPDVRGATRCTTRSSSATIVAFFALCVAYIRACDWIIGPDAEFELEEPAGDAGDAPVDADGPGGVSTPRGLRRRQLHGARTHVRAPRVPRARARLPGEVLMSAAAFVQFLVLLALLAITVPPLGRYIAKVYGSEPDGRAPGDRFFGPIERGAYRLLRVDPEAEQRWTGLRAGPRRVQPRVGASCSTASCACRRTCRSTRRTRRQ